MCIDRSRADAEKASGILVYYIGDPHTVVYETCLGPLGCRKTRRAVKCKTVELAIWASRQDLKPLELSWHHILWQPFPEIRVQMVRLNGLPGARHKVGVKKTAVV